MIYELDLQVEHEGYHIDTSLAFVQNSSGQVYLEMSLKPKVLLAQDPERGVIRFVDYFSLNGRRNFQSMIPTMVANCELYNNTPRALKHYVSRTLNVYMSVVLCKYGILSTISQLQKEFLAPMVPKVIKEEGQTPPPPPPQTPPPRLQTLPPPPPPGPPLQCVPGQGRCM